MNKICLTEIYFIQMSNGTKLKHVVNMLTHGRVDNPGGAILHSFISVSEEYGMNNVNYK